MYFRWPQVANKVIIGLSFKRKILDTQCIAFKPKAQEIIPTQDLEK